MANTYTLINSTSLSTTAASVTFSAIPATYDDLVIHISDRTGSSTGNTINVTFNSDTANNYSRIYIQGNGASALSGLASNQNQVRYETDISTNTASTFASTEIYIPSYRVAQNKPVSLANAWETNATTASIFGWASLWRNTAAITSITLTPNVNSFVSGSTFWLYGIKNS